jgi:hypothetical protein
MLILNLHKHKHIITPVWFDRAISVDALSTVPDLLYTQLYTNKGVARLGYPTSCGLLILMYKHVLCACRVILPRIAREPNQTLLAAATGF